MSILKEVEENVINSQSKFPRVSESGPSPVRMGGGNRVGVACADFFKSQSDDLRPTLQKVKDLPGPLADKAAYIKQLFKDTKDLVIKQKTALLGFALYSHLNDTDPENQQVKNDLGDFRGYIFGGMDQSAARAKLFGVTTASNEVFQSDVSASKQKSVGSIWNKLCEWMKSKAPTTTKMRQHVKAFSSLLAGGVEETKARKVNQLSDKLKR
jgi:hypothetical protein